MGISDHEARIRRLERRSGAIRRRLAALEDQLAYPKWALKLPPWSDGDRDAATPPDRPVGCAACNVPETLLFDQQAGGYSGTLAYIGSYTIASGSGSDQCVVGESVGYLSGVVKDNTIDNWYRWTLCCRDEAIDTVVWSRHTWTSLAAAEALSSSTSRTTSQLLIINSCNPVDWVQAAGVNYIFRVYEP